MEENFKKRISSEMLIGLAAVIASIAIPLAQFFVGYFEQRTTQQQNIRQEEERRRLEITKLFMDNYVGKTDEVQIATIQIMKTLDPDFFISIEGGLKEATKSDSVKASIRKATVEAATEISNDQTKKTKSTKVQKVMSANELEKQGFELLKKGDIKNAQKKFDEANQHYPSFRSSSKNGSTNGVIYQYSTASSTSQSDLEKEVWKDFYDKNKDNLSDSTRKALKKRMR